MTKIDKIVRNILFLLFAFLPWVSLPLKNQHVENLGLPSFSLSRAIGIFLPPSRVAGMHGKFALIAISVCLISFLWLAKIIISSGIKIKRTPLDKFIMLFILTVVLSMLLSDDTFKALLGWDRHREGFVAFYTYALIYFALINFIKNKEHMEQLILALSIGLAISSFQGMFQIITRSTEFGHRVTAGFTDPNFFGGFLIMMIPLMSAFAFYSKVLLRKLFFGLLSLSSFLLLLFTLSRIAYISFALSILVVLVFLLINGRGRYITVALVITLTLCVAVLLLGKFVPQESKKYFLQRVTVSSFTEGLKTRIGLWELAWKYVFDRPFLGYGPDRYRFATGNSGGYGGAHNEYLYYIVTLGWAGFGSFLLLVGAYLFRSVKAVFKKENFLSLRIGCLAGIIGYLSYIIATYNIPYVAIYFWLLLALTWLPEGFDTRNFYCISIRAAPSWIKTTSLVFVLMLFLMLIGQVLRLPVGAFYWESSRALWANGETQAAIATALKAVRLVPDSEPYWSDLGDMSLYLAKGGRRDLIRLSVVAFKKVVSEFNKGESPTWFNLGEAYRLAGEKQKAKVAYAKAIELGTSELVKQKAIVVLSEQYGLQKR